MNNPVILLDADGVFLRTLYPGDYLSRRYGVPPEKRGRYNQILGQCLIGRADLKEELPSLLEEWGIPGTAESFLHEAFSTGSGIDENVASVVAALRAQGLTCGLVTNQDRHRMEYLDRHLAIRRYFDAIFVSCELGSKKPDAEFYHAVGARFPGRELAFWDDRPENVDAAQACGWTAFLFRDSASLRTDLKSVLG